MQKIKRQGGELIYVVEETETAPLGATYFKRHDWNYITKLLKSHETNEEKAIFLDGCVAAKKANSEWRIFDSFPESLIQQTEEIFRPEPRKSEISQIAEQTINMLKRKAGKA